MKYIVLCGGFGKRLETTTGFPKPFNMVLGVHSIQRVLESIPSDEIYLFLNKNLKDIHAHTLVHHLVKKTLHCVYLDRYTRGAAETAFVGLQKSNISADEPICFFDNDTVYGECNIPVNNAIGYANTDETRPYCYLDVSSENRITDIAEKVRISNKYAAGIYSFKSRKVFEQYALSILRNEIMFNNEFYMSLIYKLMIDSYEPVVGFPIQNCICLGTPEDIEANIDKLSSKKLRVCFDIDNTIFEYRLPGQTYRDCHPIENMVTFLRQLHSAGNTIILYTARGMKTYDSNLGEVICKNGLDTLELLNKYKIPYDEIYFGKPHADIYVDDKSFNPYMNVFQATGFTHVNTPSGSSSNKFNSVTQIGDVIIKRGPKSSMGGEVYFYKSVQHTPLSSLFPTFIDGSPGKISLHFVDGPTLFDLLRDKLVTPNHIRKMMNELNRMHTYEGIPITITSDDLYGNYMGKLKTRAQNRVDYPFENTQAVLSKMDEYMKKYKYTIVPVVHGDAWFSNTLLTKQGDIIFLDMKGDINGKLTTNGDALTDYGKLYQSLLGFDCILNEIPIDNEYMDTLRTTFFENLPYAREDLNTVTGCLIAKTVSFLSEDVKPSIRQGIWNLVEQCIQYE